jgi:hypothetical protein
MRSNKAAEVKSLLGQKTGKEFKVSEHKEIALYRTIRYFTVTDDWLEDVPETLRLVPLEHVRWFMQEAGPRFLARFKQQQSQQSGGRDQSGSGFGFRFMQVRKRAGDSFPNACEVILKDTGKAGEWARRVDERQLKRAWENACAENGYEDTEEQLDVVRVSDVKMKPVEWVWPLVLVDRI